MKVTIEQIIEAAEQNGFEWTQAKFFNDKGDITQACVLGQVALNLDLSAVSLLNSLNRECSYIGNEIFRYNDYEAKTYAGAVKGLKKYLAPFKGREIEVTRSRRKRRLVRKSGI